VDQLTLWPEPEAGRVRGQVLFDPELTRPRGAPADEAARARALDFLHANLRLELDGANAELVFQVRELWTGDGAIQGDSVMLRAAMPRAARELRVFVGSPLRALAVTIETPDARGSLVPRTALVLGGHATPPFRLGGESGERWRLGGPDSLELGRVRHREGMEGARRSEAGRPAGAAGGAGLSGATGATGSAEESRARVGFRYLVRGVEHVLPNGWDHMLFVVGLVLGSWRRTRFLLVQLVGFAVAQTAALGLGALGLVLLPTQVIEPLIALSIAFVGFENLWTAGEPKHRLPWTLGFGLLHGQGFASSLLASGIPPESFVLSMLSFNVGVEVGQLFVVLGSLLLLHPAKTAESFRRYALRPGSALIAAAGVVATFARLFYPG
jgi:hypothetical protein